MQAVAERVRGRGRLTEENITSAVSDVRRALIEADVALPVVRDFIENVRARYASANPLSMAADKTAERHLPGGNTRTILHTSIKIF